MVDFETDAGRPLTPEENAYFREMRKRDERVAWIWSSLRVWATWIASIVAAYYAVTTLGKDFIQWLLKH